MIADASPLIVFAKAGRLDLLREVVGRLVVPDEVWRELVSDTAKPGAGDLLKAPWISVVASEEAMRGAVIPGLHLGERAVVALAVATGDAVLMDDRRGRAVAERLGVRVVGCVGVLLTAKRMGLVDRLAPVLAELEAAGLRLSPALRQAALSEAGEG